VSPVRPATPDDLPGAVRLFQRMMPGYAGVAASGLEAFFGRTLFDNPATDPEIPSLVYEASDGRITGFIGTQVRPMRFDGRPVRVASASHLVADPDQRLPIGALLLRAFLTGRQDVTLTDTATPTVTRMWLALGAQPRHLGGIEWIRLFKPASTAANMLAHKRRQDNRVADLVAKAIDSVLAAPVHRLLGTPPAEGWGEPLTPASMLEYMPELTESLRLVPNYNKSYLDWLFTELARPRPDGRTVATLVRTEGRVAGWHIYRLREGDLSRVAQVVAQPKDAGCVLDHLFEHASAGGAGGLRGRVEPHLLAPVSERRCGLWHIGGRLVHSRDPDLLDAINSGSAMLSMLEGEWTALLWPGRTAHDERSQPE
jgi:hypothetical protein